MENTHLNLHTHTAICKHATGRVADYCAWAVKSGLKVLGLTEHNPFPDDRLLATRPSYQEFLIYLEEIEEAKEKFPQLTILSSLEVDVDEDFPLDFYWEEFKEKAKLDYMCTGIHFAQNPANGEYNHIGINKHFSLEVVRLYTEKTVRLMKCGLFDFITHPDMVSASIDAYSPEVEKCFRKIIETSIETCTPLELNAYGFRKKMCQYEDGITRYPYPWEPFWKLAAEYKVPCVVFSDAHKPEDVLGNVPEMIRFAENLGIPCINAFLGEKILRNCGKKIKE